MCVCVFVPISVSISISVSYTYVFSESLRRTSRKFHDFWARSIHDGVRPLQDWTDGYGKSGGIKWIIFL